MNDAEKIKARIAELEAANEAAIFPERSRRMKLPYDYSRCNQSYCPLSNTCLRFLAPGRPNGSQVYSAFPAGEDCEGYIQTEETDK